MRKLTTIIAAALMIVAVQATAVSSDPFPANYQKLARDYIRKGMKDPESMKIRFIGGRGGVPEFKTDVGQWVFACVVNGKNAFGGYTANTSFTSISRMAA